MTRHAQSERHLFCDTLDGLGPDQPTLCEGWQTKDLAAHLVIREARPDLAVGMVVPFLRDRLEQGQREIADGDFTALVQRVRSGPPAWNPMGIAAVDEKANTLELFVHFEDVRRAQPDWVKRDLAPGLQAALWSSIKAMSRLTFRKAPTGVVLIAPGLGRHAAKSPQGPEGPGTVVVRGEPGEIALFASGRGAVADVSFEGADADVALLKGADFGG